ncbi:putative Nudix hydrolase NudL [Streptomyces sp. enrichment culture]
MTETTISAREQLAGLVGRSGRLPWGRAGLPRAMPQHRRTMRASAVVVVARPVAGDVAFLLVRRSWALRHHPGEFAFPGGGIEPDETPVTAALRECHEETGVALGRRHVLGTLPALALEASANVVTPVLAWAGDDVPDGPARRWHNRETQSTHWVPRSHLVDPENRITVTYGERWTGPGFLLDGTHVWGFTAHVLDRLLDELAWSRPWDTSRRYTLTEN